MQSKVFEVKPIILEQVLQIHTSSRHNNRFATDTGVTNLGFRVP